MVGEWGRAVVMRNRDRATIIAEREQASSGSGWEWGEQHRRADGQPIDHVGAQRRRWGSGCGGGIGKRCQKMGHSRARAGRVGSEASEIGESDGRPNRNQVGAAAAAIGKR